MNLLESVDKEKRQSCRDGRKRFERMLKPRLEMAYIAPRNDEEYKDEKIPSVDKLSLRCKRGKRRFEDHP